MPIPLTPEDLARYLESLDAPAPHLDFLHTVSFRAAGAAVRLGVFEALDEETVPADELANRLSVDLRGLEQLLSALAGFGYVSREPEGWASTPLARKWLRDQPGTYLTVLSFWHTVLFELWNDLEQSVRDGRPTVDFYAWLQQHPAALRAFQTMLTGLANGLCPEVLETLTLPDEHRRLLDIGGGHATYAVGFCQRYPDLTATVLDLPEALEIGAEAVLRAALTDRVRLQPGDLGSVDLDETFDVALLFNIVHGLDPDGVRSTLADVARVVRPGGRVALLEPLSDHAAGAGAVGQAFVGAFSLNLFHSQGGQVYSSQELADWLAEAGFTDLQRHRFARSPNDHLLVAVRAG